MTGEAARRRVMDLAPLAVAVAAAASHAWWHARFTMDDAAISFSYARSLAEGLGLGVLEPGGPRVEGYSNLLWVLLLAAGRTVGLPIEGTAKALGAGSLLGSVWLLHSLIVRLVHRPEARWAALLLPLTTCVVLWSMSGLESGLYLVLLLGACRLHLHEEDDPRWWNVGSAPILVLAGLVRPEGFVFALGALAARVFTLALEPGRRSLHTRQLAAWLPALLAGYGAYFAWHLAVFSSAFPNTVYAKGAAPALGHLGARLLDLESPGWLYVRSWLDGRAGHALLPLALVGMIAAVRGPGRVVVAFAGAALALPLLHPDWMVEHRFLVPFVPFSVALSAVGLDWVLDRASRAAARATLLRRLALACSILMGLVYAGANLRASEARRATGYAGCVSQESVQAFYHHLFDDPVRQLGLTRPLAAIPDLGATTFLLNLRVLDLAGLADASVAHARQDPTQLNLYLFGERRPDLVHAHGHWLWFSQLPVLPGLRDYVMVSSRHGPDLDDNAFEAVRKDLFVEPLQAGVASTALAGDLGLVGLDGPAAVEAGATIPFDVYLTSSGARPAAVELRLEVTRPDGSILLARELSCGPSFYTCQQWEAGERVRMRLDIRLDAEVAAPAGALAVRLAARRPGQGDWHAAPGRQLTVDAAMAALEAMSLLEEAGRRAAAGDVREMERAVELAQAAAPSLGGWPARRAGLATAAASGLAVAAEASIRQGDWRTALRLLERTERLGSGRTSSPGLRALSLRLRREAATAPDERSAYLFYRGAWAANPQDTEAQRGLIEARRAHLQRLAQ